MTTSPLKEALGRLNPQQRDAVLLSLDQNALCIAGAGSGKTAVATIRLAYLIEEKGVPPTSLLLLTFTNKAANEMKERVAQLVGHEVASKIMAGTFHSVCVRLLRQFQRHLGFEKPFIIYAEDDSRDLVREILKELSYDHSKRDVARVKDMISGWKNQLLTPERVGEILQTSAGDPTERLAHRVYVQYQERLRRNCALDFDDLIMRMVQLLETVPEVREYCHRRFKYIEVDEFQDTNWAQAELIRLMKGPDCNLFVVGEVVAHVKRRELRGTPKACHPLPPRNEAATRNSGQDATMGNPQPSLQTGGRFRDYVRRRPHLA